jgi:mannose-1-phosphate guanylyltransferase
VLLALTPVLEHSPEAIVAITPSDHGVVDDAAFRRGVLDAVRQVRGRGDVVLFGVEPVAAHQDYGWISVDAESTVRGFRAVTSFVEKPASDVAARLLASGAVWNTMVIVAKARAIRDLYQEWLPDLSKVFARAWRQSASERTAFFASVYPTLPSLDFSRDLLGAARGLSAYVWPASMGWSDLGTPDRLAEWHQRVSATRAIPAA